MVHKKQLLPCLALVQSTQTFRSRRKHSLEIELSRLPGLRGAYPQSSNDVTIPIPFEQGNLVFSLGVSVPFPKDLHTLRRTILRDRNVREFSHRPLKK